MLDVMRNQPPARAAVQRQVNRVRRHDTTCMVLMNRPQLADDPVGLGWWDEREECWRAAERGGSLGGSSVPWRAELPAPPEEPKPGARRLPWRCEATDRVHHLLGQMGAKELQCQPLREALRWYGDESRAASKNMAAEAHQAGVLASLTVLSLDSGRRSDTSLTPAGELVADGAPQP